MPKRRSGDVRLDHAAQCGPELTRIAAGCRTAQRKLCGATFSPRAWTSKHLRASRPGMASPNSAAGRGIRRKGCGRLPYRHLDGLASQALRNIGSNPLLPRRLLSAALHEFINEFSATLPLPALRAPCDGGLSADDRRRHGEAAIDGSVEWHEAHRRFHGC